MTDNTSWLDQAHAIAYDLGSDVQAAHALGVTAQTVRGWFQDGRTPRAATRQRIADVHAELCARRVPDLSTDGAAAAAAESLILARQTCAAVLEMDTIEQAHDQAHRCAAIIDRRLARLT